MCLHSYLSLVTTATLGILAYFEYILVKFLHIQKMNKMVLEAIRPKV